MNLNIENQMTKAKQTPADMIGLTVPAQQQDDLDIRPVRVTMDQNGTWHAIQTPDANLELVFSRKTLKLIRVKLVK